MQRVRLEHRFQAAGGIRVLTGRFQLREMRRDLPVMPGREDGLDVRKVLVQRRPTDARGLGDLRHGRTDAAARDDSRRGVECCVADRIPMLPHRLTPQLRHIPSIPPPVYNCVGYRDILY